MFKFNPLLKSILEEYEIVYKLQLIREYVVCRRQIDIWVIRILE